LGVGCASVEISACPSPELSDRNLISTTPHQQMRCELRAQRPRLRIVPLQWVCRYERALAIHEKVLGPEHPDANRVRFNLARLLLAGSQPTEALAPGQTALAAHDKALGRDHDWTKDSARVTADALAALGRTEKAKALRERYGVTEPDKS